MSIKIKNETGQHVKYFAAKYDEAQRTYFIATDEFLTVRRSCGLGSDVQSLPGTDAEKIESFAPWIKIKPALREL